MTTADPTKPEALPPEGTQDWQLLVTPGHVLGHRLIDVGKTYQGRAWLAGIGAAVAAVLAVAGGTVLPVAVSNLANAPVKWLAEATQTDPNTYTVLPGGERTTYRLAWLADVPRAQGMTAEAWTALLVAANEDVGRYGDRAANYAAIPKLSTQPTVTRPAKAFAKYSDRLAGGVVALPDREGGTMAHVVGHVDGVLTWAVLTRYGCHVVLGSAVPNGCQKSGVGAYIGEMQAFRPTAEAAK